MEFRETLLAAQRNQQQKSSENHYYKARFDPPKKEQKSRDKLSDNIKKFLAKKEEEEKQKKLEAQRKRDELLAMRDPKALRKIQKTLKVIKSANKSVIADAIDRDNTAVTRDGPDQPDQDDYGYVSQEANALYEKMMQKYSKIPDEPKFSVSQGSVKKDLKGTVERVKHALQHEDDPVPHKRRRRKENGVLEKEPTPPREPEKKKDEKPEKPKVRRPMPPPMDFNQLLKLAEQKKNEPLEIGMKKVDKESEPERPMTKKQRREYEEELARRQRRLERMEAEKGGGKKIPKDSRPIENERKPDPGGIGRIPKITDKMNGNYRNDAPKGQDRERNDRDRDRDRGDKDRNEKDRERNDRDRDRSERDRNDRDRDRNDREREYRDRERERLLRERERAIAEKERAFSEKEKEREKLRLDKERLDKLKAERERIDREMERLNKDREKLEKAKMKLETKTVEKKPLDKSIDKSRLMSKEQTRQDIKKSIDLKSQNTFRIDKNSNEKKVVPSKDGKYMNGHSSQMNSVPKGVTKDLVREKMAIAQGKQKLLSDGSQKLNSQGLQDRRLMEKGMKRPDDKKPQAGPSKMSNSFDFDKHVSSLKGKERPPGSMKQKSQQKPKRRLDSDSEYDSEMDDFIDDGDENLDYSRHIKEIFGYDKSKYRYMDDDDDPNMESSFVQVQREEYISKKQGILEDLEDMRMEAMEKAKKGKKKRRISED